jgi:branched-chain amino acid aminotransferase
VTDQLSAIWINGERQPPGQAHVSARDRGLTLSDGVFETMRAWRGIVFRLNRHLDRIRHALGMLDIPAPARLNDWVRDAVGGMNGADASVRLTVTRGPGAAGVAPPAEVHPTVIVAINPPPVFAPAIYEVGLTCRIASGRRNERAMTAGLKTLSYTESVAAYLEAHRAGDDDAILLDTEGHCSEATSSNLFIWTGTMLVTPPVSCGALPGITRAAVLELARADDIPAVERAFTLNDLLTADEAFLTSSLRGLAPLVRVDGHRLGSGAPGAVTRQMIGAYADLVARECAG